VGHGAVAGGAVRGPADPGAGGGARPRLPRSADRAGRLAGLRGPGRPRHDAGPAGLAELPPTRTCP
jgi:hypothetical protein